MHFLAIIILILKIGLQSVLHKVFFFQTKKKNFWNPTIFQGMSVFPVRRVIVPKTHRYRCPNTKLHLPHQLPIQNYDPLYQQKLYTFFLDSECWEDCIDFSMMFFLLYSIFPHSILIPIFTHDTFKDR